MIMFQLKLYLMFLLLIRKILPNKFTNCLFVSRYGMTYSWENLLGWKHNFSFHSSSIHIGHGDVYMMTLLLMAGFLTVKRQSAVQCLCGFSVRVCVYSRSDGLKWQIIVSFLKHSLNNTFTINTASTSGQFILVKTFQA